MRILSLRPNLFRILVIPSVFIFIIYLVVLTSRAADWPNLESPTAQPLKPPHHPASFSSSLPSSSIASPPSQNPSSPSTLDPLARRPTIVMGATQKSDISWVSRELPQFESAIYSVDNSPHLTLHTPANKGKEAMAYLTYIIDNNHNLLNISIFLHSHRDITAGGWHIESSDGSNVMSVLQLQQPMVLERGYVNLRCTGKPGCEGKGIRPVRTAEEIGAEGVDVSGMEPNYPGAWRAMMGEGVELPKRVATPCCAQFAVARWAILKREKGEYERYRTWLLETELADEISGRVFEYMWHVIFGRPAVDCEEYGQCVKAVYSW